MIIIKHGHVCHGDVHIKPDVDNTFEHYRNVLCGVTNKLHCKYIEIITSFGLVVRRKTFFSTCVMFLTGVIAKNCLCKR